MNRTVVSIRLKGLLRYLLVRAKLRYLSGGRGHRLTNMTILGRAVALDLGDLEQKYLAADCVREPENLIIYKAIAAAGLASTFIDIGANCGHVALSIVHDYEHIFVFEPNPKLAHLLRSIFSGCRNVTVKECAIVDAESVGTLTLTVPDDSSGLATLGRTTLSAEHGENHTYVVRASALDSEVTEAALANAYIKIDVEGYEPSIIRSMRQLLHSQRPIVGFEASSHAIALECTRLFAGYRFYFSRFDFLEAGGTLSKSVGGIGAALILGGNIDIVSVDDMSQISLNHFKIGRAHV